MEAHFIIGQCFIAIGQRDQGVAHLKIALDMAIARNSLSTEDIKKYLDKATRVTPTLPPGSEIQNRSKEKYVCNVRNDSIILTSTSSSSSSSTITTATTTTTTTTKMTTVSAVIIERQQQMEELEDREIVSDDGEQNEESEIERPVVRKIYGRQLQQGAEKVNNIRVSLLNDKCLDNLLSLKKKELLES